MAPMQYTYTCKGHDRITATLARVSVENRIGYVERSSAREVAMGSLQGAGEEVGVGICDGYGDFA